jgi:DNA-binding CsgD family transcriptional regulator
MTGASTLHDAVAVVAETCRAGLELDELRRRVLPSIRRGVPVDALWWAAADPTTLLFTRPDWEEIPAETGPYFVANEFLADDVNKWTELARDQRGVRTLMEATGGRMEQSPRYRDIFRPLRLGDELRAVLRADGECWGYLCMHREGPNGFSEQEARFVERIAPHLAVGFRLATLIGTVRVGGFTSPGLVLVAGDGSLSLTNAAGEQWLEELGAPSARGDVPLEVLAVAARLRDTDGPTEQPPRLRVRTRAGRWAVLHASWLGDPAKRSIAVIIEPAEPTEVLPLLVAAYGLTRQERRVTERVCQGLSTVEIAARLHVTTNTVQDHLKSIFTKTGIRSRRELVVALLKQQNR